MLTHRLELAFDHRVYFTRGVADPGNAVLDRALLETPRALAVVEEAVAAWKSFEQHARELQEHAQRWPGQALAGGDLASRLVQFSEKRLK